MSSHWVEQTVHEVGKIYSYIRSYSYLDLETNWKIKNKKSVGGKATEIPVSVQASL